MTYIFDDDILLLLHGLSSLEKLFNATPGVKVVQGKCSMELLRVDHLHRALETNLARHYFLMYGIAPRIHEKKSLWLLRI